MNAFDHRASVERADSLWRGIDAIVLDAVGTLIYPSPAVADAYADAASRQGIEVDHGVLKARFARAFRNDEADEHRGPLATDEAVERRRWRRIVSEVLSEVPDQDRAFGELWDHFGRASSWACFSDVEQLLRLVREHGIAIRIASNFDARLRPIVAALAPFSGLENALIVSSEVGFRKPHSAFFEAVRASLELPAERILCVGDDIENDVRGAERAGMKGVLLDRAGTAAEAGLTAVCDLDSLAAHWLA